MLAPPAIPSNARCVAAGLAVAACFACGGDAPAPTAPSAVVVRSLTVVLVRAEPGYQATAVAAFSDGSSREVTREAQWSSSNAAVATASETGSVSVVASHQDRHHARSAPVHAIRPHPRIRHQRRWFTGNTFGNVMARLEPADGIVNPWPSSSNATFTLAATLPGTWNYHIMIEPAGLPTTGTLTVSVTSP